MKNLKVKVRRSDASGASHYQTYTVPYYPGMRLLDALIYIQENLDPSLSFRFNCRAGRCGSDGMELNGKPVLACKYTISSEESEFTISPMRVFPVTRDLVVNLSEAWKDAVKIPAFESSQRSDTPAIIDKEKIEEVRGLKRCIECFLCQDVCHVLRTKNAAYIGPRWVAKAASYDKHPLDKIRNRSSQLAKNGLWKCNISRCCQENCPEKIRITDDAIISAKEQDVDETVSIGAMLRRLRKGRK